MIGIIWGSLSPVLQKHRNANDELYFSDEDCTWMVTSQNLGYFVGCSLLTLVGDKVGRNTVIISSTLLVLVSCSVALIKKVILLQLSRFLAGMTVGINAIIIPIYIGENSSPNVRGVFNSVTNLFIDVGMIFSSSVTTYCSYEISAVIFVAASLVNLLSEMLLREPAQHLLAKGRQTKAENQFFWLRGRNEVSQKEFDDITMSLNEEKAKFSWTFVFDRNFQITAVMSTFMVLTGYFPVVSLVSIILVPTKKLPTNELAILFNVFQLSGSVISPFIIDRFRRRTLWIFSAILVTVSHIFTAALYICREKGFEVWNAEWLLFGSVTAYATIFAALMYPLGMIVKVELLQQKCRTVGCSTLWILNCLMYSIEAHFFLWIATTFGLHFNFLFFAICSLIILVFGYFYLPETRGMSLTDIEKILENPDKKTSEK